VDDSVITRDDIRGLGV